MNERIRSFWKNERAQVGGIFTFVLALGIFSLMYIIFSVIMDHIITTNNEFLSSFHHTQEFADAMNVCFLWWAALPIIIILALIIWLIKNAIKARTETVT